MSNRTFGVYSLTKMAICLSLLCVSAYITIPVPFASAMLSAQTIVLNLAAFILRARQTLVVMLIYLLLGAIGIPVFVGGSCGIGEFFGPRGGFLFAFAVAYPLISLLKGKKHSVKRYFLTAVAVGIPITYLGAVISVMYFMQVDLKAAFLITVLPFLPGDVIKAFIASIIGVRINNVRSD